MTSFFESQKSEKNIKIISLVALSMTLMCRSLALFQTKFCWIFLGNMPIGPHCTVGGWPCVKKLHFGLHSPNSTHVCRARARGERWRRRETLWMTWQRRRRRVRTSLIYVDDDTRASSPCIPAASSACAVTTTRRSASGRYYFRAGDACTIDHGSAQLYHSQQRRHQNSM